MDYITCPACRQRFQIDERHYGHAVPCHCGKELLIPEIEREEPPAPPPATRRSADPGTARTLRRRLAGRMDEAAVAARKPYAMAAIVLLLPVIGLGFAPWIDVLVGISPYTVIEHSAKLLEATENTPEAGKVVGVFVQASYGYAIGLFVCVSGMFEAIRDGKSLAMTTGFFVCTLACVAWFVRWRTLFDDATPPSEDVARLGEALGIGLTPAFYVACGTSFCGGVVAVLAQTRRAYLGATARRAPRRGNP